MSADERPAKRPRPDDAEPSPDSTPIVRSPDFWFDEGNIILQVESTQFRVMKSFLAMHSTVFRGMLLVPLPPYEPLVEGCPVVVLSGDTKEEWESMFAVMFPKMPDITHLAAVLRLSVKYDMAEFRKECCARLRVDFPATWKQFLKNREKTSWQCFTYEEDQCISQLIGPVREAGLYSTLPAMFYQLLLEILDQEGEPHLTPPDQILFLKGCLRLSSLHELHPEVKWLDSVPSPSCSDGEKCSTTVAALQATRADCFPAAFLRWQKAWGRDFCSACLAAGQQRYSEEQEDLWEKLPSFFGLPDWKELTRLDAE